MRNAAKRKRLRQWHSFIDKFEEGKRGDIAAAIASFEQKEAARVERLKSAVQSWRSYVGTQDPHGPEKKEPFYAKWFQESPEKSVSKILTQQLGNERALFLALKKIDEKATTELGTVLEGTTCVSDLGSLAAPSEGGDKEVQQPDSVVASVVYVMDFKGDIMATQVPKMKDEITALLALPAENRPEEVVLRLYSQGGAVFGYGLAEAELRRLKEQQIKLTVCIDAVVPFVHVWICFLLSSF